PPQLPAGLPSALLERRPDIRQAEQNLVAANADVGVAKALFFPQISLNASAGPAWGHSTFVGSNGASLAGSSVPGGIGSGAFSTIAAPPFIWTYVISALQPIFEGGYLRSNLRFARSEERQAVISYEQTVLRAFGDVSDALFAYEKYHGVRER